MRDPSSRKGSQYTSVVMAGLVPAIHAETPRLLCLTEPQLHGVDGRDEHGHDNIELAAGSAPGALQNDRREHKQ